MIPEFLLTSFIVVASPGTFVVFVGYGLFAASLRRHVISRPSVLTWMRRMFAGAFAALGLRLALTDR